MQYLILFIVALAAWLVDSSLQAIYYLSIGPYGVQTHGTESATYFGLGIYYSACYFVLISLPAFFILTLKQLWYSRKISKVESACSQSEKSVSIPRWFYITYVILFTAGICFNHVDHEIVRFMGTRYSLEMLKAYNLFSGATDFVLDTLQTDERGSYSSLILLLIPLAFLTIFLVFGKKICSLASRLALRVPRLVNIIVAAILYIACISLFGSAMCAYIHKDLNGYSVIAPSRRQTLVSPMILTLLQDFRHSYSITANDYSVIDEDIRQYQSLWLSEEPDSNWQFVSEANPLQKSYRGTCPPPVGGKQPNFVILFLETNRAMNLPDFNRFAKSDPMPFLHSLITGENAIMKNNGMTSSWYSRFNASGLPTVDAHTASHIGIPAHAHFTVSSSFLHSRFPSYASILRRHGYDTMFIDSSDGAFTNWGLWLDRWYDSHVDLKTGDDRIAMKRLGDSILEKRSQNRPFMITLATMTNHIPFNVPDGGSQPPEDLPFRERINYTMSYVDGALKEFFERMDENNALKDTIFMILADHGYSLGDIPGKLVLGENYNTLRYNVVWIPMIMISNITGMPSGEYRNVSSQVDLAPTIMSAAGICEDNSFVGHSLLNSRAHHVLVNKDGNFLWCDNDYTAIYVKSEQPQLFRTDDVIQENELWKSEPDVAEKMKAQAVSYRRVIDYVYEMDLVPRLNP